MMDVPASAVRGYAGGEKFDRDLLIECEVVGVVDLAHAALAKQSDDLIVARQHRARSEARRSAAG